MKKFTQLLEEFEFTRDSNKYVTKNILNLSFIKSLELQEKHIDVYDYEINISVPTSHFGDWGDPIHDMKSLEKEMKLLFKKNIKFTVMSLTSNKGGFADFKYSVNY